MSIDFHGINQRLLDNAEGFLRDLFPAGKVRGHEFVVGDIDGNAGESLSINMRTGIGADFATDERFSDLIAVYASHHRIAMGEAAKRLSNGAGERYPPRATEPQVSRPPLPDSPTCHHGSYGYPSHVYRYEDTLGLLYVVARYDTPAGKQILPWAWTGDAWQPKSYSKPRPLYNLKELQANPRGSVMVVEGEKCVDKLLAMRIQRIPTTWAGGAQAWKHADWSVLAGCDVVLFPDHDAPGYKCMREIGQHLLGIAARVRYINHESDDRPDGWDIADTAWSAVDLAEWASELYEEVKAPEPKKPPPIDPDDPGPGEDTPRERNRRRNHPDVLKPLIGDMALADMSKILATNAPGRQWLFEEIIPVGAFLIVGRPKVGKSWLLLQLAIAATTCRDFLGFQALGRFGVLYIGCEDDVTRVKARFLRFQVETPQNLHVVVRESLLELVEKFSPHYTLEQWLDGYLEANPHIKLVLLDTETTIRNMWEGENGGSQEKSITKKDYMDVTVFDRIALKRNAFIGLVNHTAKRKGNGQWADIHELINRTNTALAGASGSIVIADPPGHDPMDTDSRVRVLGIRGRDIDKEYLIALEQTKCGAFEAIGRWSAYQQTEAEQAIWDALIELNEESPNSWFKSSEIAAEIGKTMGAVKRAISRMAAAGKLTRGEWRMETKKRMGARLHPIHATKTGDDK